MRRVSGALAIVLLLGAPAARAEIVDRILAVVSGQIITLSDVNAALRFGLVPADVSTDPVNAALQRLIDRRVMLEEAERYASAEPSPAEVAAAVAAVRETFADDLAFERALGQTAMTRERLAGAVRDSLRFDAYVEQRLASTAPPSEEEILRYYREHPDEFTSAGSLRPFSDVRDQALARVRAARREAFVSDWVAGLRRRASIVVLYLPGGGGKG